MVVVALSCRWHVAHASGRLSHYENRTVEQLIKKARNQLGPGSYEMARGSRQWQLPAACSSFSGTLRCARTHPPVDLSGEQARVCFGLQL